MGIFRTYMLYRTVSFMSLWKISGFDMSSNFVYYYRGNLVLLWQLAQGKWLI